jgi:hypothetical protein
MRQFGDEYLCTSIKTLVGSDRLYVVGHHVDFDVEMIKEVAVVGD